MPCLMPCHPMTEYGLRSSWNLNCVDSRGSFIVNLSLGWLAEAIEEQLRDDFGRLQHPEAMEALKASPWGSYKAITLIEATIGIPSVAVTLNSVLMCTVNAGCEASGRRRQNNIFIISVVYQKCWLYVAFLTSKCVSCWVKHPAERGSIVHEGIFWNGNCLPHFRYMFSICLVN